MLSDYYYSITHHRHTQYSVANHDSNWSTNNNYYYNYNKLHNNI